MTSVSGGLEFLPEVASEEDALFPLETAEYSDPRLLPQQTALLSWRAWDVASENRSCGPRSICWDHRLTEVGDSHSEGRVTGRLGGGDSAPFP